MKVHDIFALALEHNLVHAKSVLYKNKKTVTIEKEVSKSIVLPDSFVTFFETCQMLRMRENTKLLIYNGTFKGIEKLRVLCSVTCAGVKTNMYFYTFIGEGKPYIERFTFETNRMSFFVPLKVRTIYKFIENEKNK